MKKLSSQAVSDLHSKVKAKTKTEIVADKATNKALINKITSQREMLYKYPENCDEALQRKNFRAKVRKELAKLERNLNLIHKGKSDGVAKEIEKQIQTFKSKHYKPAK